jgi:predicted permease
MLQDLILAVRLLRRTPGFALLAVLCLTLGIGATTAVCGWIEGILIRPFPAVADQDRLVALAGTAAGRPGYDDLSWPDFQDYRRGCKLIESFIADRICRTTLAVGDRAQVATGSVVSANYFPALGVRLILGRGFEPAEETGRNGHPVTVISYRTWQDRYGGDAHIVGRTQMLNGQEHTIVGVTTAGFNGTFVGYAFQFWVPAAMQERFDPDGYKLEDRGARWIEGFARLKPGVTRAQAQAEITAVARRLEGAFPATDRGRGVELLPLWRTPFNNAGTLLPTLRIALAVALLVLLIACANVANLLLVRAVARRHEMAVRLALGAAPGRLVRQLLTEGLVLAGLGAAGGLAAAYVFRNVMAAFFPPRPGIVVNLPSQLDWRVLAASGVASLGSALLFGLIPAWQASKVDQAGAMRSETGGVVGGRGGTSLRSGLVVAQFALSFALLVGTGLLLRSLRGLEGADPGFATRDVLSTNVDLRGAGYDAQRTRSFEDRLIDRLVGLRGVRGAAFARATPFSYRGFSAAPIAVQGYVPAPNEDSVVEYNEVGADYLATTGIALIAGRDLARSDDQSAPLVAVINDTLAHRYWHDRDPLGQRLQVNGRWVRVVGVARTAKYSTLREEPKPFFYVPMRQSAMGGNLAIRTALDPRALAPVLAREVRALDAGLVPGEVITMREQVDRMSWPQRAAVILLVIFGAVALLLATVGLYGVMSYAVSQGARELGLRMALGAAAPDLLRLVMTRGGILTACGLMLGTAAALGASRLLENLLYRVSPRDPLAFCAAALALTLAALAACLLPAWRAMRTNPLEALRA